MAAKKPDYRLKVLNKETNERCNDAGAGWKNKDGSISIVLSPCITLVNNKNLVITLFTIGEDT